MRRYFFWLLVVLLAGTPALAGSPSYILVDVDSGTVLDHNQSDALWHPASLTKLMTAYLAFRALKDGDLKLTSPVTISQHALDQAPAKMGFKVGTVMNVDNALKMMLVHSANDIAVAVAETVGGSEPKFVAMMNAEARNLGMASTHYDNANGLPDDGQTTTARDLAVLARAVWTDFPEYRNYFGIPAIKAGKRILRSQNSLLDEYRGTLGMKTGFICASGYNIVATARRGGRTMMAVVLGATSSGDRGETAARLLDQGFFTWGAANKPKLAAFESAGAVGAPADMQNLVCGRRTAQADEDSGGDPTSTSGHQYLGPQFFVMDPVPVFTGHADASLPTATDTAKTDTTVKKVPLPRVRPKATGSAADAVTSPASADAAESEFLSREAAIELETR